MLCPIEPRLAKKLIPPLTNLIQSTGAMSLLYECIHTVVVGGLLTAEGIDATSVSALCIGRLKLFLEDTDPNLKYLGLFVLSKLLHTNPRAVLEHKEIVLRCLEDADSSIRLRALEIVTGMVTQKNLKELIKRLIQHLVPSDKAHSSSLDSQYRSEVVNRVLTLCSQNTYELVLDFEVSLSLFTTRLYEPLSRFLIFGACSANASVVRRRPGGLSTFRGRECKPGSECAIYGRGHPSSCRARVCCANGRK